jgi:hypothetical protein
MENMGISCGNYSDLPGIFPSSSLRRLLLGLKHPTGNDTVRARPSNCSAKEIHGETHRNCSPGNNPMMYIYIYNDALNWKISYSIPKQQASNFEPSCFIYPSLSEITAGHTQRSCYTVGSPYSRITKTLIEWIISLGFIKSLEAKFHDLI